MGSLEALFHTSRWNCQSRYPTFPNSRMDFLKQLTNPPKHNDLYQGSHVTHRPCGVLLGRMICNLRKSAFPFSNREKKKRKNPDEIVSATSSYYISPGPLIYMSINSFSVLELIRLESIFIGQRGRATKNLNSTMICNTP